MTPMLLRLAVLALILPCAQVGAEALPFSVPVPIGGADGAAGLISADLDRDGDPDLIYAQRDAARVAWSRRESDGYAAPQTLFAREGVIAIAVADFDADGRLDLATATVGGVVAWHRRSGSDPDGVPQFDLLRPGVSGIDGVTVLHAADLSADGRIDLLLGRDAAPALQLLLRNPSSASGFDPPSALPLPSGVGTITALASADIDADGRADPIATSNPQGGNASPQLFWVPHQSATSFAPAVVVDSVPPIFPTTFDTVAVLDIERDGDADLVFSQFEVTILAGSVFAHRNDGNGFAGGAAARETLIASAAGRYRGLLAHDLDRDGDDDVIAAFAGLTPPAVHHFDNGRDAWTRRDLTPTAAAGVIALAVADDDRDGDPDLLGLQSDGVLLRSANQRVHGRIFSADCVPRGRATGSFFTTAFEGPFEIGVPPDGDRFFFTEFDGGRLHAAEVGSGFAPGCEQPATLNFTAPLLSDFGAARALAWADLDSDGDQDFLLGTGELASPAPGNQNRVTVGLVSDAAGVSVSSTVLTCSGGDDIRGVALGDLDGNGSVDLAYASEDNDAIVIALVPCISETLVSSAANGIPNGPGSVEAVDLDDDGDLDLLFSARMDSTSTPPRQGDLVGWYPNLGGAAFGALQTIGSVDGAVDAVAVDFDRDGRIDVATVSQGDPLLDPLAGRVLLFRNLGAGLFAPAQVAASGMHQGGRPSFADLDHDGDVDIVLPTGSERTRAPDRDQCGVNLIEAQGDGGFALPRCLDLPGSGSNDLAGPHSRVALADSDHDGVLEILATRFADDAMSGFDPDRPHQFLQQRTLLDPQRVIERSGETCLRSLRVTHQGRVGDSPLQVARIELDMLGASSADLVDLAARIVLRRDDGDDQPEPAQDLEIARSDAPQSSVWELSVPNGSAGSTLDPGATGRWWLCAQPGPQRREFARFSNLGLVDLVDASGVALDGHFTGDADTGDRLLSATLFRDGLE
jgi:hypothetical protein